ncbi:unnamed protein product [Lampetra fluviatilis]
MRSTVAAKFDDDDDDDNNNERSPTVTGTPARLEGVSLSRGMQAQIKGAGGGAVGGDPQEDDAVKASGVGFMTSPAVWLLLLRLAPAAVAVVVVAWSVNAGDRAARRTESLTGVLPAMASG